MRINCGFHANATSTSGVNNITFDIQQTQTQQSSHEEAKQYNCLIKKIKKITLAKTTIMAYTCEGNFGKHSSV